MKRKAVYKNAVIEQRAPNIAPAIPKYMGPIMVRVVVKTVKKL